MTLRRARIQRTLGSLTWPRWARTTLLLALMVMSSIGHASAMITTMPSDAFIGRSVQVLPEEHCGAVTCRGNAHDPSECCGGGPCACIPETASTVPIIKTDATRDCGHPQTLTGRIRTGLDRPPKRS